MADAMDVDEPRGTKRKADELSAAPHRIKACSYAVLVWIWIVH